MKQEQTAADMAAYKVLADMMYIGGSSVCKREVETDAPEACKGSAGTDVPEACKGSAAADLLEACKGPADGTGVEAGTVQDLRAAEDRLHIQCSKHEVQH
jgi:hypothetical protein